MTTGLDEFLSQGVLIALDLEGAKQLFAARQPAALRQFLAERLAAGPATDYALCGGQWSRLEEVLDQPDLVHASLRPALQQCLTRGRALCTEPGLGVWLARPDLVPHIAEALVRISPETLRRQLETQRIAMVDAACEAFHQIQDLYRRAAQQHAAVVFAAQEKPPADSA